MVDPNICEICSKIAPCAAHLSISNGPVKSDQLYDRGMSGLLSAIGVDQL